MNNYRSLNIVTLQGRLGANAEVKQTKSGHAYVSFSLATQTSVKDQNGNWTHPTTWHACKFFGARAAKIAPMLVKGATITVLGQLSNFETNTEGRKVRLTYVNVEDITGIMKPAASQQAQSAQPAVSPDPGQPPIGYDAYEASQGGDVTYDF